LAVSWSREVGSNALVECKEGFQRLLGDSDLVCGEGGWLRRSDLVPAVLLQCEAINAWCPPVDNAFNVLTNTVTRSMSSGREYGSRVLLECRAGHVPLYGNSSVWCGLNPQKTSGEWKTMTFDPLGEPLTASLLQCVKGRGYCSALPLSEGVKHVNWTTSGEGSKLGATVAVECEVGYVPLRGESVFTCGSNGYDNSVWTLVPWLKVPEASKGLVEVGSVLKCVKLQDFCTPLIDRPYMVSSMGQGTLIYSEVSLACPEGYVRTAGGH
jgi:hypothetical protein